MLSPALDGNVIIRKYDPKKAQHKKVADKWIISPLTGERIPADKLYEHMRYSTVDSQYKEQRERELSDHNEDDPVFALGQDISKNLVKFAERRTDIFGHDAEQTMIGKKFGEGEGTFRDPDPKLIWDGQQSTIDQTTRLAQQSATLEEQINEIHKRHGYVADSSKKRIGPDPVPPPPAAQRSTRQPPATLPPPRPPAPAAVARLRPRVPGAASALPAGMAALRAPSGPRVVPGVPLSVPVIQPPAIGVRTPVMVPLSTPPVIPAAATASAAKSSASGAQMEGPPAKRARTEDDLESEASWLTKVSGSITVSVQTPNITPNRDWKLLGSTLSVSVKVAAPVSTLKSVIQDMTGLPTSKQKLTFDGFFLKNASSLAFYNMNTGSVVQLQIKERGGKKK